MAENALRSVLCRSAKAHKILHTPSRGCFSGTAGGTAGLLSETLHDRHIARSDSTPKTLQDLPGPTGYPVLGTAPEYFRKANRGRMHEVQRNFHRRHGKMFKEKLGPVTNVSVADPSIVEEIIRKEGKIPFRPPYDSWILYKKLRDQDKGISTAVGQEWLRFRRALAKKLLPPKNVAEYVEVMNDVTTSLVKRIRKLRDTVGDGKCVPGMPRELQKWATETVTGVLLEERLGLLEHEMDPKISEFIESVEKMLLTGHQLMVFADVHQRLGTKPWKTHVQAWDYIYEVATELIDKKLADMRLEEERHGDDETFRGRKASFLRHMLTNTGLSMSEIYTNTAELLLSGVDTSSNAFSFAMYLLAENPNVQERLQAEVDKVCQGRLCNYEDLQNLPYVKAVLKETLRMYPVLPINARVMQEDTVLNGHTIPKNTCVLINTYTMAHDEDVFDNAETFMPERWLREGAKEHSHFAMLPFGFGSRMCVGRRIAEQELYLAIINITQSFWLNPSTTYKLEPTLRTVLSPGKELPVEFVDR